jgi:hypothetical protein
MRATGRAVCIASGPRFRLVATFADGVEEASRDGFESVTAAQADVGAFIRDIAARGRPTALRVERVEHAAAEGNGKLHEPRATTLTFKRWDVTVIDRILAQRPQHEFSQPPVARTPPDVVPAAGSAEPTAPDAEPILPTAVEMELPNLESPPPAAVPVIAAEQAPEAPSFEGEITPAPRESPAAALGQHHAHYRPRHRRTRWTLILTAAFVVILVGGMLLLETNGDPLTYFRKLGSGEKVRETLPFRNGHAPATRPTVGRHGP